MRERERGSGEQIKRQKKIEEREENDGERILRGE